MNANTATPRPWLKITLALLACATAIAVGIMLSKENSAPEVQFQTITGEKFSTSQLKGKVVLVNFWATSCVTCVAEMPMLTATHQKYAPLGYEMVAVAMSYDRPDYVVNFATTRRLPFKVALDLKGAAAKAFGDVKLTPTSFLLDKQGNIIKTYLGQPDVTQFEQLIEKALKT